MTETKTAAAPASPTRRASRFPPGASAPPDGSGKNNAYCQDNPLSRIDWSLVEANRDMLRLMRELIALRRRRGCLTANRFFDGRPVPGRGVPEIAGHGARLGEAPWHDTLGCLPAFTKAGLGKAEEDLHVVLDLSDQAVDAALPSTPGRHWHLALDTPWAPPAHILARELREPSGGISHLVNARSAMVLEARP